MFPTSIVLMQVDGLFNDAVRWYFLNTFAAYYL